MQIIIDFLVQTIGALGYFGIFVLMFLESSFFPFPSEVVMIPAGYLAYQGEMNFLLIIFMGILGSVAGAWLNYFLAYFFGEKLLIKIIKKEKVYKLNSFFEKHGHISTFNGRLLPGIRQYISFPAGLAKMNIIIFSIFTALGAGIWSLVLTLIGYYMGANQELIHKYLKEATLLAVIFVVIISLIYYKRKVKGKK